jgi:hypothetical protein
MDTTKIIKTSKKIDNGLRQILEDLGPEMEKVRINYAQAVVDYIRKEHGKVVTRNHIYLIVNNHQRLNPDNLYIAQAVKKILKDFKKDREEVLS